MFVGSGHAKKEKSTFSMMKGSTCSLDFIGEQQCASLQCFRLDGLFSVVLMAMLHRI